LGRCICIFTSLHSAVNYETFRISLSLLYTQDHLSWTAEIFQDTAVNESLRVSFGHNRTATPRTTNLPCVFTSLTRRYSGLLDFPRPHTPAKSRDGYTNLIPRVLELVRSPDVTGFVSGAGAPPNSDASRRPYSPRIPRLPSTRF